MCTVFQSIPPWKQLDELEPETQDQNSKKKYYKKHAKQSAVSLKNKKASQCWLIQHMKNKFKNKTKNIKTTLWNMEY